MLTEVSLELRPILPRVAENPKEGGLESTDRVSGREQIILQLCRVDDCIRCVRKFQKAPRLGAIVPGDAKRATRELSAVTIGVDPVRSGAISEKRALLVARAIHEDNLHFAVSADALEEFMQVVARKEF